ncbi:uncharacterized protein [Amphiura filiformis]|uniref:uncharacterized protein n=1 Tax=Amphiura filiformis TaxID=82378 RepID=UPI003B20D889
MANNSLQRQESEVESFPSGKQETEAECNVESRQESEAESEVKGSDESENKQDNDVESLPRDQESEAEGEVKHSDEDESKQENEVETFPQDQESEAESEVKNSDEDESKQDNEVESFPRDQESEAECEVKNSDEDESKQDNEVESFPRDQESESECEVRSSHEDESEAEYEVSSDEDESKQENEVETFPRDQESEAECEVKNSDEDESEQDNEVESFPRDQESESEWEVRSSDEDESEAEYEVSSDEDKSKQENEVETFPRDQESEAEREVKNSDEDESKQDNEVESLPQDQESEAESEVKSSDEDEGEVKSLPHRIPKNRIKVLCTNNKKGKRKWDKGSYCPFCRKRQMKLPRHMENVHKDETKVMQWVATKDKGLRDQRLTKLRNLGNFYHNSDVLQKKKGTIIPVYRPKSGDADYTNYLPCSLCLGYYAKRDLWKHGCKMKEKEKSEGEPPKKKRRRAYVKTARCMLPSDGMSKTVQKVCAGLRLDHEGVSTFIKHDCLMLKLAEKFTFKLGHDDYQFTYIRAKLREVGRMMLVFRKVAGLVNATLTDAIDPERFNDVVKATRAVAGFNNDTHIYKTPTLALKIGHSLKKAAAILLGEALSGGDCILERRAEQFMKLIDLQWTDKISTHALRTLNENKRNAPQYLPVTEDIVKLTNFLQKKMEERMKSLQMSKDTCRSDTEFAYKELAEVTLTSLLLFNRKRSGEVSRMKVVDYSKCEKGNVEKGVMEGLSDFEKRLCGVLWRTEIKGKKGRNVPILLTPKLKESMDLLSAFRSTAGIDNDNQYFFATLSSSGFIRGSDVLRKFAGACGASHPEYLRSTRLRKHIGTVCQVMNLQENEQDILASFMGHDLRVHREFYRLPERTLQLAKVSKVLLQMQAGNIRNLAGRSLNDVEIEEEDVPLDEPLEEAPDNEVDVLEFDEAEYQPTTEVVQKVSNPPRNTAPRRKCPADPFADVTNVPKRTSKKKSLGSEITEKKKQNSKKTFNKRRTWTHEEKSAMAVKFKTYFRVVGKLPGKMEILTIQSKTPALRSRTWKNIKDFIRNCQRKDDPLYFL